MDFARQLEAIEFLLKHYLVGVSTARSELEQLRSNEAMVRAVLRDLDGIYCCPANAFLSWCLMRSLISIRPANFREAIMLDQVSPVCQCSDSIQRIEYCLEHYQLVLVGDVKPFRLSLGV